jgi:hypothetical protein
MTSREEVWFTKFTHDDWAVASAATARVASGAARRFDRFIMGFRKRGNGNGNGKEAVGKRLTGTSPRR